jgi:NDP-sugar pyrophosphorylase family protein
MRMGPLTDALPKPMAPYNGSTLIASGIGKLRPHIPLIHITVGYKAAMLAQHVIEQGVASLHNTEGQHPNSWWLYHTLMKFIDEPIYVLTCDNILELDFDLLEENYFDLACPPNMIVPVKVVRGLDGDFIHADGHLVRALGRHLKSDIYCSGIQIINPHRINMMTKEGQSFYDVWQQLIVQDSLWLSTIYPKKWMAVDTLEQLILLNHGGAPAIARLPR